MLCDVHPNGEARQLCDGNIRLALRDSLEKLDPVAPGEVAKVRIDMWATGIRVFAGHRLRLHVGSAAVPGVRAAYEHVGTTGRGDRSPHCAKPRPSRRRPSIAAVTSRAGVKSQRRKAESSGVSWPATTEHPIMRTAALLAILLTTPLTHAAENAWIRVNQIGYLPGRSKDCHHLQRRRAHGYVPRRRFHRGYRPRPGRLGTLCAQLPTRLFSHVCSWALRRRIRTNSITIVHDR